jgi:hypothetical protein
VKLPDDILAAVEAYDRARNAFHESVLDSLWHQQTGDALDAAVYRLADLVSAWAKERRRG